MIVAKPWAEFRADFPSDQVEDGSDIVQFGGRNVAQAIAGLLAGFGCVIEEPYHAEEHGWQCSFTYENLPLWFQIQELGPSYLFVCKEPLISGHSEHPLYFQALIKLNDALREDGRFHDLAWHDYNERGDRLSSSELPVIGEVPKRLEMPPMAEKPKLSFVQKLLAPLMRQSWIK